jgi:4,5:9,10-diseco-3-hydroxy-5,9,17-trioxoandrosta-1(10),2-diene-4-oate hydrolase
VIHGGGGDARTWLSNMEVLAEKYTVFAPDLPGFGGSARLDGSYYIPELTHFIKKFTECLELGKFYIMGHSLGGGIALNFAISYPDKIKKLVLVSSLCLGREIALWVRLFSLPAFIKSVGHVFMGVMASIKWIASQLNPARYIMALSPAAMTVGSSISTFREQTLSLEKRLPEVKMPTLLVWGSRDPVVPVMQAYRAALASPNCQVKVFDKRGHNVHRDELEEFSSILRRFLD